MAIRQRGNTFQVDVKVKNQRVRETALTWAKAEELESQVKYVLKSGQDWATYKVQMGGLTRIRPESRGMTLKQAVQCEWDDNWQTRKSADKMWFLSSRLMKILGEDTRVRDITGEEIIRVKTTLAAEHHCSNSTINRHLAALKKILRDCRDKWDAVDRIPKIEMMREHQGRIRYLDNREESDLLAFFRFIGADPMAEFVTVCLDTGVRLSEGLRIEGRDVEDGRVSLWETKTDYPRTIPLTDRSRDILEDRLSAHGRGVLFPELDKNRVERLWSRGREHLGLEDDKQFVFYALRHTCATRLMQRGAPVNVVKEWLGHKAVATTMRYVHLAPNSLSLWVDASAG